jgi:ABC-2 type transport system permease protein
MRVLLAFWEKEWLALSRDVHGLAVLFVMPAAFIVVMSLALSDVFKEDSARRTGFAVLAAGGPKIAEQIAGHLAGEGWFAAPAPQDEAGARDSLRRGELGAVLVVGGDFPASPTLTVLADPALSPVRLVGFQQRVMGLMLGTRHAPAVSLEVIGYPRGGRPSSVQQSVPAWLIFGMFFVVMPMSALFIVERREGTLARLASQRVPGAMLLAGKIGPYFVINLVQAGLMLAAGVALVPLLGGEALALPARGDLLAAVAAATSIASIGWGLLVAVLARTMEQATVIGGVGNILAAAIGGIMVPRVVMPPAMQELAELSPMAWALDAFHAVMLRSGGLADIALPCLKLLLLGAALGAAALWIHGRRRTRGLPA